MGHIVQIERNNETYSVILQVNSINRRLLIMLSKTTKYVIFGILLVVLFPFKTFPVTFNFTPGSPEANEYLDAPSAFWEPDDYYAPSPDYLNHDLPLNVTKNVNTAYSDPIWSLSGWCLDLGQMNTWNANHSYVKVLGRLRQVVNYPNDPHYEYWRYVVFYPYTPNSGVTQVPDPSATSEAVNKNLGLPASGICPTDSLAGNPVNVATGNKYEEVTDISLSSPTPLTFTRSYNSRAVADGPLGYGWTHNYHITLQVVATSPYTRIKITDADGRALYFQPIMQTYADGTHFYGESGVKDRLIQLTAGGYLLKRENSQTYTFSSDGALNQIADAVGNTLSFTYTSGLLTQVTNNFGKSLTIQYSGTYISSITDPKGQSFSYSYTGNDLTLVSYPDGRSVTYAYSSHLLTDKYDTSSNLIAHWSYDTSGRVISHYKSVVNSVPQEAMTFTYGTNSTTLTTSNGDTVYNTTIKDGIRVITSIEGCGSTCGGTHKSFTYNDTVDLTDVTFTSGGQTYTTHYTYDTPTNWWDLVGEITQTTEAVGWPQERTTVFGYTHRTDHPFLLTQSTQTKASVVTTGTTTKTTTYDTAGNTSSVSRTGYVMVGSTPTQTTRTTSYQYNTLGQLTQINGPRTDVSDITSFTYYANDASQGNNQGQLYMITNALNQTTTFSSYDANGNVGAITDPNGISTTFTYDQRNRLLTSTTQSLVTQYGYDAHGNLSYIIPPEGNRIDYTYTLTDKLSEIRDNLGNHIAYTYDVEGNRISENIYDPSNTLKKYLSFTHDTYNRLKRIVNPDATYTEYGYDDKGNKTSIIDPRTNATTYMYDPLDRLVGVTQPLNSLIDYGYDSHDNPYYVIDPNDYTTQYSYDDFGGRYRVISPDPGLSTASFDSAGNVTGQTDANGSVITLTYDVINRPTLIQFFDPSQNISYTYDAGTYGKGHLTGRTDPSGTYSFSYDGWGNLTQEQKTISGVLYSTHYSYNGNNAVSSMVYPSGRTVAYSRDVAGRVTQVSTNGTNLVSNITYTPFGGITSLTYGNGLVLSKGYDNQYRLSSLVVGSFLGLSYNYDPNGNITSIIDGVNPPGGPVDQAGTYTYVTGSNKLDSIAGNNPVAFGYDANGNTTSENTRVLGYDLLNRLTSVTDNGTQISSYAYNALNQRVSKTTGGNTRIFHYDLAGHLIAETTNTGSTIAEYIYLGDDLLAQIRSGNNYYYHNEHLGTPQVMTNSSGSVVWKASYTAFGKAQVMVNTTENNIRFPGQYFDSETGLHYNWNRYYQPETGRYVTPDPIGLGGGVNVYGYVGGNPVGWVDPNGLIPIDTIWDVGNIIYDILTGRWDDLALDTVAAFIPYVPAGISKVAKVGKTACNLSKRAKIKKAQLPQKGKIRYMPPKSWHPSENLPRGENNGFEDRFGNEWVKGPSRTQGQDFEWDVQRPDGTHWNISLDGKVTH
jgi:RHS repeat-associated protein